MTYQSLGILLFVPDPYSVHLERNLLPLGTDSQDVGAQAQLLPLRCTHPLPQRVQTVQCDCLLPMIH